MQFLAFIKPDCLSDKCRVLKSGAKIFSDQTKKKLHIFRKRICNHNLFTIKMNNNAIKNVESLKILGIYFSKKYTWKENYIPLKKFLVQRVNLIEFISIKRSYVHILVKSLTLSRVDYGLFLVGNTTKYNINIIKCSGRFWKRKY